MKSYSVIVSNVGTVHTGTDKEEALREYLAYVACAEEATGRMGGEDVVLFCDDEIIEEHSGYLHARGYR